MVHEHLMPASYIAHNSDHWSCYAFMSYTTSCKQCNIRIIVLNICWVTIICHLQTRSWIIIGNLFISTASNAITKKKLVWSTWWPYFFNLEITQIDSGQTFVLAWNLVGMRMLDAILFLVLCITGHKNTKMMIKITRMNSIRKRVILLTFLMKSG